MTVLVAGGINEDLVIEVAALPRAGETTIAQGVRSSAGGKGLNQAIAAARFGAKTRLLGAMGDDEPARMIRAIMRESDVIDDGILVDPDRPTGRAFITLGNDGENMIIVDAAANLSFGAREMTGSIRQAVVSLTQFEAQPDAIEALFRSELSGYRILNAAPALTAHGALLELADLLIVNETEFLAFANLSALPEGIEALAHAARALLRGAVKHIVITLGARGCVLVDARTHLLMEAFRVPVVNTVGAGDCFCGVVAAALAEGMPLASALRYGCAASALAVGRPGAADAMPNREEIDALLSAMSDGTRPAMAG